MATSPTLRSRLPALSPANHGGQRRGTNAETPSLFPDPRDSRPPTEGAPTPPQASCLGGDATNPSGGIARLALSSPLVDEKRQTEYYLLPAKSIINRCNSDRVPFPWTVNPYRGCEFGCKYCYARYTHEFMELEPEAFERKIYAKAETGTLAARELAASDLRDQHIAIGTATDPYQPAEDEFHATRSVLEAMSRQSGLSLSITTKSNRVVRDIDLLRRVAEKSSLTVNMTVVTLNERLARRLEPRAPRPDLRLAAVTKLREAGITVGINAMPVLPGITDRESDCDALTRAARDAGAQWLAAGVLFLMPSSLAVFLPFLEKEFPRLAKRYREWYTQHAYAPEAYRKEISARFTALRERYGLGCRPEVPDRPAGGAQLQLNWAAA